MTFPADERVLPGPRGELLARLRQGRESAIHGIVPQRTSRHAPFPLSIAQERLWFLDQLVPGQSFYNIPAALRVRGPLQVRILEQCATEAARRHEVLRTTFRVDADGPRQVVGDPVDVVLPVIDLERLPPAAQ